MKKALTIALSTLMILGTGCSSLFGVSGQEMKTRAFSEKEQAQLEGTEFDKLNRKEVQRFVEDSVYEDLVDELADQGYYIENIEAEYVESPKVSEEYLEELAYNSKENIYFGYKLSELTKKFKGDKFVFTTGKDGETKVQRFQECKKAENSYKKAMKNLAVGSGVILVCVTASAATAGAAPAVSMVFAVSAKTAACGAISSGAIGGTIAGLITGAKTGDWDAAMKSAAEVGSEQFKWGAIGGAIVGGVAEGRGLYGAARNGLSLNEAAMIQREAKYPLDVIKRFESMDQYKICKESGLTAKMINNKTALVREIDWKFTDELGRTNLQRAEQGLAPLDSSGKAYELHHVGQEAESTLAILTKSEHMKDGNDLIWHNKKKPSVVHGAKNRAKWVNEKKSFWKSMAKQQRG